MAAGWDGLDALSAATPERPRSLHAKRLQYQEQGHGLYLIGWSDELAVGHLLLKWPGWPERPWTMEFQATYGCSLVEDLWVQPRSRGMGIGRALMETAHSHSNQQGIPSVGLGVGMDPGYAAARRLYRSLGYRDPGHGRFIASGPGWIEELTFWLAATVCPTTR